MNLGPLDDVRDLAALLNPTVLKRLWEAGALDPQTVVAATRALPWAIGRGPSIGVLGQIHGRARPDRVAIHDRWGELTWSRLDARSNQLAHAFRERGLEGKGRVATLVRNGREAVETILATQKMGMTVAPLNTWAKPKELRYAIEQQEPDLLVFDAKHAEQVQESLADATPLVVVGDTDGVATSAAPYEGLLDGQPEGPPPPLTRDRGSPRIVIHTSGTTGRAKAAKRGAGGSDVTGLVRLLSVVPYRSDDVILCPAPLFHSFGLLTLSIGLTLGCTMVLPERFDPKESLALMERHDVTAASFVPVMIRRLLSLPKEDRERHRRDALRIVLASGSAMSPEFRRDARELFGDVLYDLYGSTEAGWVAIATPEDMRDEPSTVGRPVPGVEVAILDDDGNELDAGERGGIYVKSDASFEGYESGEDVPIVDGHIGMGDTGWIDEDGRLFVEGRADDMVVVGGENVYPAEVEEVIDGVEGVEDVAVVGVPDDEFGQVLKAFVQGSADPEKVKDVCRKELPKFKVPREVEIVDELPRNSTGKVLKRELVPTE